VPNEPAGTPEAAAGSHQGECTYTVDNVCRVFDIPPNEGNVPEVKLYDVPNTGEFEMNGPGRFADGVAGE
jgi:hypothetical protein